MEYELFIVSPAEPFRSLVEEAQRLEREGNPGPLGKNARRDAFRWVAVDGLSRYWDVRCGNG